MKNNYPQWATVGEHTYHGPDLVLHRWGAEQISIGKFCSISQGVKIMAGGNHRTDCVSTFPFDTMLTRTANHPTNDRSYNAKNGDVKIGSDVWIGYGASIYGSCTIGDGAVIAAGAVVFGDVPPYGICAGNPGRTNKMRHSESITEALLRINWWDWSEDLIRMRVDDFYLPIRKFVAKYDPWMRVPIEQAEESCSA